MINSSQHILFIGFVWPEPNSSAGGARTMQLIEQFQQQNWKVTFASAAADSEYAVDLKALNIDKVSIQLNNKNFDDFIKKLNPSIVVFDKFYTEEQFGWRVAENCPDALRILDTIDLHCLRLARQKALKENKTFTTNNLYSDAAKREIASILRSDISLIISTVEMNLLQNHFKIDKALLYYLPFLLNPIEKDTVSNWPNYEERKGFMTIGNFLHEPNWDSVLYLKKEIWPLIRKQLPDAKLYIYGSYPSQKVNELHKPNEGFYIMGRAENVKNVFQKARICLAPLRFGAGLKGKLIDAMKYGTPSITTDTGAESMHDNLEWNGSISNTAEEFASAAVKLYKDESAWIKAQANGIKIINTCFSKKSGEDFIHQIITVQESITKHRSENFMGAILLHHNVASTKYMSQWIEEKNKIN